MNAPGVAIGIGFGLLSVLLILRRVTSLRHPLDAHVPYVWWFFLSFGVAELFSFTAGIWILAVLCFLALKEYFTLLDIRWQDRWAILGAYAAIPFMIYYIQIDWYGMFIISIPVYAFLVIPFLIVLGGPEAKGSVFSIGAIDLGLFLFVYCVGHLGYLASYSTWKALVVILSVVLCDLVAALLPDRSPVGWSRAILRIVVSIPLTVVLFRVLSGWTGIPVLHSVVLGVLCPLLAGMGRVTIGHLETDLGIDRLAAVPGKGRIVDTLRSFLYVSPIAFHYIRYYVG